ncbi:MAG TPA: DUF2975 domain-containing protein [Acidimicrobiales bacterium]|nr:DUF2975 domain-containing protein [Acidimicrobiales bacterium]
MGRLMVLALRAVMAMMLAGSLFVQVAMVPLMAIDLEEADSDLAHLQIPFAVVMILVILTAQVTLLCVWRLVTMVRRGTLFSPDAFRYVDVVIGAAAAAAVLTFALAVILAPGEAIAPGVVLLVCGGTVGAVGIGLIVLVMRTLLAQAISREAEAHELRAELDEVI